MATASLTGEDRLLGEHDVVFGDSLARTVEWIVTDAVRVNTAAAWRDAASQLRGIDRLLETMREGSDRFVYAVLALGNHMSRAELLAEDPQARADLAATLTAAGVL